MNFPNPPGGSDHWSGLEFIGISNASVHPTNMKANKKPQNFCFLKKAHLLLYFISGVLLSRTPDIK